MPTRLVKKGVTVVRDGVRVRPEINKGFDFTKEEIDAITATDAATLGSAKDAEAVEEGTAEVASTTAAAPSSAEKSQAAAKGGKKASTANKSDDEAASDDL